MTRIRTVRERKMGGESQEYRMTMRERQDKSLSSIMADKENSDLEMVISQQMAEAVNTEDLG